MIIDFSAHLITREVASRVSKDESPRCFQKNASLETSDPEFRIAQMEKYGIDMQVLTQGLPLVNGMKPEEAADLCRVSNDAIGKICLWYPDRFIPFASVSLLDMNHAVRELDRAVKEWGCRGVTVAADHTRTGLDDPQTEPFFERVCEHDIPVFLHPAESHPCALAKEDPAVVHFIGRPLDTTLAVLKLVLNGVMERYPTLKIVTHHLGGGLLPFFSGRFANELPNLRHKMKRPFSESLSRIYGDTAVDGTAAALPCGHDFFGTGRMLFGTDYPFSPENGERTLRENLAIIKEWNLPDPEKEKILGGNAVELLKL